MNKTFVLEEKSKISLKNLYLDEILFIAGVLFLLLSQFLLYKNAPYVKDYNSSKVYEQLGIANGKVIATQYISLCFFIVCSLLNLRKFLLNRKNLFIFFCIFIIFIVSCVHFLYVILNSGFSAALYNSVTPIVYLLILTIFLGANPRIFNIFIKINYFITFYSLIYALALFISFKSIHPDGLIGNSAILKYFIQGFVSAMITCYYLKNRLISFLIIFLCLLLSFFCSTRSFIIQSILFLIVYVVMTSKRKFISFLITLIIGLLLLIISFNILKNYFPSTYEYFIYKLEQDTRSGQYIQLFSQINLLDLIIGQSYYFKYVWNGVLYSYIDNTFIFLAMRYGFIFLIPFCVVLFVPFYRGIKSKHIYKKVLAIFILQIIMAFGGLSVYFVVDLDLKMLIIYLILGKCLSK